MLMISSSSLQDPLGVIFIYELSLSTSFFHQQVHHTSEFTVYGVIYI